ncbi:MAG: ABC transporter ATP-binding protein [Phycisphaerales bacterium]|nr:ABC transporter ATP-binding protein [Phycisphaerales bacterium]
MSLFESSQQAAPPETAGSSANRADHFRRLFGLTWRYRWGCLVALVWDVGVEALALCGFIYSGLALDILRDQAQPEASAPPRWPLGLAPPADWPLWKTLSLASGAVLVITLLRTYARYRTRLSSETLIQRITVDLRTALYDKLQRLGFSWFDTHDSGGLINRVTGDAGSVRLFIEGVVLQLIISATALTLFLFYMFREHAWLTLALLAVFPVQAWILVRYSRSIERRLRTNREALDRFIQTLQECIIGVKVVKGFGQERQVMGRFAVRNTDAYEARMAITKTNASLLPWITTLGFLQIAILLLYGGHLVNLGPAAGGIALGTLWVFFSLVRQLAGQVETIVSSASSIPESLVGAARVFELLDAPVEIAAPPDAYAPKEIRGRIEFDRVSFRYRPDTPLVLEDVSFVVEPGESVAMVGPAGGGKSTIFDLIGRFYDATSGRVLVDGVDVRQWDPVALRRAVSIVFQEPFLFSNTIANNVRFGVPDAPDEAVQRAVRDAIAEEFVTAAKDGYETIIGERGLTLSGGERQRLSIARAILPDAPILLLDDAMASVDARTEVRIAANLDRVMRGRTTLLIAHRLSTLRRADRVLVVERGRIVAQGTHETLMRESDHYREAALLQLDRDRQEESGSLASQEVAP